jgi:hypothetical protein
VLAADLTAVAVAWSGWMWILVFLAGPRYACQVPGCST